MSITDPFLSHMPVHQAMHTGVLVTEPATPLAVVAKLMAEQRVHAVAVADPNLGGRPFGLVSALTIAAAVADGDDALTAGQAASDEFVTITADSSMADAARLMVSNGVDHLLVIEPTTGRATGILSSMDVVTAYAC
jgi:CBS domain-containing protein